MQTWGVPNGNLKHTVSTACRPGVFLMEISKYRQYSMQTWGVPNGNLKHTMSVQHADLGCS